MVQRFAFVASLLLLASSVGAISPTCDEALSGVPATLFPPDMVSEYEDALGADGFPRQTCVARIPGKDDLVVAYSHGADTAIGIVRGGELITLDLAERVPGAYPQIAFSQIDGKADPEVLLMTSTGKAFSTWVFRMAGDEFRMIGPVIEHRGAPVSLLDSEVELIDVTGDGLADLVQPRFLDSRTVFEVFSWSEDGLRSLGTSPWYALYERESGAPVAWQDPIQATPGMYLMRVINGPDDHTPATAGEIMINGKSVFNSGDFKAHSRLLERKLQLDENNTLSVEVRGEPGARILLILLPL